MADNLPGLDDLLKSIREDDKPQSSSALAVVPKKPDDLVEEDIDSQILSILGLEDVFDLTYEEYASLLKEAAIVGRMPYSQMTTESIGLITDELKRVKGKTGRFKVKPKKVDINKVLNRRQPTPSGAIVKAQKLIPQGSDVAEEPKVKPKVDSENLQDELLNGIGNILESLVTIRKILGNQNKVEEKIVEKDRKETEKKKKKEKEATLEKKKPSFKLPGMLSKPVDDFFGAIKRFFTNVLLGSVVLAAFKWFKDPGNQQTIQGFSDFLQKSAPLILGGLLAIAALPIASSLLGLTGSVLGGIAILSGALKFLATPAGLFALTTYLTREGLYKIALPPLAKGMNKVIEQGYKKDYGEGNAARGKFITKLGDQYGRIAPKKEFEKMTGEEKTTAAFIQMYDDELKNRQRINNELYELKRDMKAMPQQEWRYKPQIQKKEKELSESDSKLKQIESQLKIGGKSLSELQKQFEEKGVSALPQTSLSKRLYPSQSINPQTPAVPSQKGLPALPRTNTLPGKQHYGAERGGGRKHAGVDFDAGPNDTFYSRIGGEVTNIDYDPSGYYNYVDIYNPQLGVTERIAEGDKILVQKGQKVSPGTPVAKGTNTTGVFHYEIRKGKSTTFGFAGTLDPIAFLGNPTKQTQVAQPPSAQVGQTPISTPSIPSPTGRGNIVPLPILSAGGQQSTQSNSAPLQTPAPRFSSEDPNNMTTMVVKSIYNVVG
jgi:murein DD-endopeptidase MepM/ murein hydrolase activator NlpD